MKKIVVMVFLTCINIVSNAQIQRGALKGNGYYGTNSSLAQNPNAFGFNSRGIYSAQDETKDYAVFEMPNLSATQIKAALFSKLSSMYKSPKDVITNISDSIIQLEGYASNVYYDIRESASCPADFSFTMIIQIKDGKVRYNIPIINQIYLQDFPFLGTARLNMEKPLSSLVTSPADRTSVAQYFNKLINTLNNAIRTSDDW